MFQEYLAINKIFKRPILNVSTIIEKNELYKSKIKTFTLTWISTLVAIKIQIKTKFILKNGQNIQYNVC